MNEQINYIHEDPSYVKKPLKIVDICDYYLIVTPSNGPFSGASKVKQFSTIDRALELYKEMDILPEVMDTPFEVNKETLDFITSICGRSISNTTATIPKLIMDITKMIEFRELQQSWMKLTTNTPITSLRKYESTRSTNYENRIQKNITNELEAYEAHSCNFGLVNDNQQVLNSIVTESIFVVYNTLYNIALVIKDVKEFFEQVCHDFSEFHIMAHLPLTTPEYDIYEEAKSFFHQKIFDEEEELEKKVTAFKSLYNITSNIHSTQTWNEKEAVQNILKNMYEINSDPKERKKAVDLYRHISSLIPGIDRTESETSLHKRLAIYFMEAGLTRKRFTDGIYYYGIRNKKQQDINTSIEEMLKQRNYEPVKSRD